MKLFEYLDAKYPDFVILQGTVKGSQGPARQWLFHTLTDFVQFQNDVIAQLQKAGQEELLTGVVDNNYYGFMYGNSTSHVSVKPTFQNKQGVVQMSVRVEIVYSA